VQRSLSSVAEPSIGVFARPVEVSRKARSPRRCPVGVSWIAARWLRCRLSPAGVRCHRPCASGSSVRIVDRGGRDVLHCRRSRRATGKGKVHFGPESAELFRGFARCRGISTPQVGGAVCKSCARRAVEVPPQALAPLISGERSAGQACRGGLFARG